MSRTVPVSLSIGGGETPADHRELVAIGIAHVGCVEVGVVQQSQTGCAFRSSTVRKRGGMECIDVPPALRPQRHHATVAHARRLSVEWFAYPEGVLHGAILFIQTPTDPTRPAGFALARRVAAGVAEHSECRVVELRRALEIVRTQAEVREHGIHDATLTLRLPTADHALLKFERRESSR